MSAQHVLVFVVGIIFFGYLTVRAVQSALRSKRSSDYIMSVAVFSFVLGIISVFLGNWMLGAFFIFVLMIPLSIVGMTIMLKNPLEFEESMRRGSLFPFLINEKIAQIANKIGLIQTIILLYLVLVVSSAAVLLAVSYPIGPSFSDIVAYVMFGPACVLYFYHKFLKKRVKAN